MSFARVLVWLSTAWLLSLSWFAPASAAAAGATRAAGAETRIVEPIDDAQRIELEGQVYRRVRQSVDLGEIDPHLPAQKVIMLLQESAEQSAALQQFLRDAQTRGNANYHHWLTPAAFGERYGVAASDIATITGWLQSKGFHVDEVPAGARTIIFSGTMGQLNDVFSTRMHRYQWHGEFHVANATNPQIPKALAGVVRGFDSLHDFRHQAQLIRSQTTPQFTSGSNHYLAPRDFATIYDLNTPYSDGITGSGLGIAIIGRSDVLTSDITTFRTDFGLGAATFTTIVNGTDPGHVSGDETESDLDIEWAGAVAPAAAITFVTSKSTSMTDGIDLSTQYAVSHNLADVISVSYAGCESTSDLSGGTTTYNQLWQQAAAQGTSVFVASGDAGAAGCDADTESTAILGPGVNTVCTSPYSTCVGGTEFTADVSNPGGYWNASNSPGSQASVLGYIGEAVWNQSGTVAGGSDLWASGGGASIYFAKPEWQLATGVPSDGHRDVPDVSFNAAGNHDPYLVVGGGQLIAVGGTSAATPSMAGIAALVDQTQGGRVGSFNPPLYALSTQQSNGGATVFHRITSGNNSVPGQSGFSASTSDPTYNQATGLGSLDAAQLIAQWHSFSGLPAGLSTTHVVIPASAFIGDVALTLPPNTSWTASVSAGAASWLAITPTGGTSSSAASSVPLSYSAAANSAATPRSGTISIAGQVLTVTQAAATASSGNAGLIQLSSSSVSFGSDGVGQATTTTQPLLVSNVGNASLTLGTIGLNGSMASDFSDAGSCVTGLVLAPGSSCYLNITFDPNVAGAMAAMLQIGVAGGGSASVSLSGAGTANVPMPPWALGGLGALLAAMACRTRMPTHAT